MNKPITKSLFVDYKSFEKLARWKVHSPEKYKFIKKIESEEDQEKIIRLGQEVENVVAEYLQKKHGASKVDLFPSIPKPTTVDGSEEEEDNDMWVYEQDKRNYFERINDACKATLDAIRRQDKILYQPSFLIDSCFVRADFMVLGENGQYDLLEVKAKTTVRKDVTSSGVKYPIGEINKDLIHDISFQKYVINKTFQEESLPLLGKTYLVHLNKDYTRKGPLDVMQLVTQQQTDISETITVIQGAKEKEVEKIIDDTLLSAQQVKDTITKINIDMELDEENFNKKYQFPGNKYVEYFAENRPFGTIMGRGVHHSLKDTISDFYYQGKTKIDNLTEDERECFNSKSAKDGQGTSRNFMEKYLHARSGSNPIIEQEEITNFFDQFTDPICFYDYETVSVPIPFMDDTHAYQQVVVQYSLHKYYPDGTMKHYGGLLQGLGEKKVEQVTLSENKNAVAHESEKLVTGSYKDLLEEFLIDIGEDINTASFIVWNKGFENTRNKETGKTYPDLLDSYTKINENTYDLMDIAGKMWYFDLGFEGSASIKKVLPVLVPEMSYKGMGVPNGAVAMDVLHKLISGEMNNPERRKQVIEDLLLYCGQDSLAMMRIWEEVKTVL